MSLNPLADFRDLAAFRRVCRDHARHLPNAAFRHVWGGGPARRAVPPIRLARPRPDGLDQPPNIVGRHCGGVSMRRINVGIIGTGWCGGIRATACAENPLIDGLYLAEINPDRLADGTLGEPVNALVSRHLSRNLGNKINTRTRLSPAAMEATHDIDWVLWCVEPAKPVRVYCQSVSKVNRHKNNTPDTSLITVTLDTGMIFTIGAGWILPPGYPNYSRTWIEFVGTEGALFIDDSRTDVALMTMQGGLVHPMSTMPGEPVGHGFAGPMARETDHFVSAVALDRPVLVTPEQARQVMEVYIAADISAERNEPVDLPLRLGDNRLSAAVA